MKKRLKKYKGSILAVVVVVIALLAIMGTSMLTVAFGARRQAIVVKNEAAAMAAAEAAYEKAVFWMGQQPDMLTSLINNDPGTSGTLNFAESWCDYQIEFAAFMGSRPVFRIIATGHCGSANRIVRVYVVQAISGWDMGQCRVPVSPTYTAPVNFADGEIIDMPIHINSYGDDPDLVDIHINGAPRFTRRVTMGESRYSITDGSDKYNGITDLFEEGIFFDQPASRITDEATVNNKITRFENSTDPQFTYTPTADASVTNGHPATQIEFYVDGGVGKVRITDNCTVRGYQYTGYRDTRRTYDYMNVPGTSGSQYMKYDIYGYHYSSDSSPSVVYDVDETYVTQSYGGVDSDPGGQIFVDGNVIVGGEEDFQEIMGKVTIVATGNIWVADSLMVAGSRDGEGKPALDNPNVLGLVAKGVVKVVDPGMTEELGGPASLANLTYEPIGIDDGTGVNYQRHLGDQTIVEAAITVGGGGWGAENVARYDYGSFYGGRKEWSGNQDELVLRGTLSEAIRGVVGLIGYDGYLKYYYLDERMLCGILPGDIWLKGKYIPVPGGWSDYRTDN